MHVEQSIMGSHLMGWCNGFVDGYQFIRAYEDIHVQFCQ